MVREQIEVAQRREGDLERLFIADHLREIQHPERVGVFAVVEIHSVEVVVVNIKLKDTAIGKRLQTRHVGEIDLGQEKEFAAVRGGGEVHPFRQIWRAANFTFPPIGGPGRLCLNSDKRLPGSEQAVAERFQCGGEIQMHDGQEK